MQNHTTLMHSTNKTPFSIGRATVKVMLVLSVCLPNSLLTYVASAQTDSVGTTPRYERIISAGGSITEILAAIGLSDRLVAVDTSSQFPPTLDSLPRVGYFRALGAEGVLSLSPDLLVAARGAGPEKVLQQIESAGTEVRQFEQSVYTLESWQTMVADIGHFFARQSAANELIKTTKQAIAGSLKNRSYQTNSLNALALLEAGQRGLVAAGKNTVADLLLNIAGVNNLANELNGYKPYSSELLATKRIDLIFVPSHTLAGMGGVAGLCANQALKLASSGECNVIVMDPLLLLGFGARLDQALEQIVDNANKAS